MHFNKETIKVYDMTCASCEARVENAIKKINGVNNAIASYKQQQVIVEYDSDLCSIEMVKNAVISAGYSTKNSTNFKIVGIFIIAAAMILLGTSTASSFDINSKLNGASFFMLFIVGILTSLHCVGMCGGIMLSQSIVKESSNKFEAVKPAILYNAGRVTAYTILGGIAGALGSALSLSIYAKAGLQIFAGIFMIIMGLNMSGFSLFRKLNFKLPWSACSVKKKPKTPFFVGMLNGLMPCGPLQTMQLYALGTGSFAKGALSMFLFSLGTVPLMLTFGAVSGILNKGYTKMLLKFSGIIVVILGLIMGSRGLTLAGISVPTLSFNNSNINTAYGSTGSSNAAKAQIQNGVQIIKMTADNNGYTPNALYVQKNIPVKWIIDGKQLNSCNYELIIPSLNIQKQLNSGENVIEFTPKDSDINFSCGMGMIRGIIKVVDNIKTTDTSKADSSIPPSSSGGSCCNGGSAPSSNTAAQQSIYGSDITKVDTNTLVNKAAINSGSQNIKIDGINSEFKPLIAVVQKNIGVNLTIDLSKFSSTAGTFNIVNINTNTVVKSLNSTQGIISTNINFDTAGGYAIEKNNTALGVIEVVDDLNTADINTIRKKYLP